MLALLVVTAATVISGDLADEITESSLNDALARFREDVSVGLVSPQALLGPAANGTDVWQPPLQSLIAKQEDGYLADPTTQTLLVLYEVLQNQVSALSLSLFFGSGNVGLTSISFADLLQPHGSLKRHGLRGWRP